ncbi:hypothetical protein RFI_06716 [Reticulomyxa filosa]|uniref:Methyltransferase domain-containing protein n=1 Tax=Reticulomyxa filosa TaxID=46433 RepID=X6NX63_RETFI|nr:hypothetical protein RFI_06716 [Reticulomyxa filosa]|eukprot:ETO30404.1 hypothetical protein RFI_06716 [Reticulomyxa filosa]
MNIKWYEYEYVNKYDRKGDRKRKKEGFEVRLCVYIGKEILGLMLKYISNVMDDPSNPTYHQIRVTNKTYQKKIGATKYKEEALQVFRLGNFKPTRIETGNSDNRVVEEYLVISEPKSLEQLSELSDVWFLIQIKLWFDAYDEKSKSFKLPDTLGAAMGKFLQDVSINLVQSGVVNSMKSSGFQHYLNESLKAKDAFSRYENFARALQMTPQFFAPDNVGLDDFFSSWICCKFIYTSFFTDSSALSESTSKKESNEEKKEEQEEEEEKKEETSVDADTKSKQLNEKRNEIRIVDIGCGWGNIGRCLSAHFRSKIEKADWSKMQLFGFDISQEMIDLGKKTRVWKHLQRNARLGLQKRKATIDCIVSANCLLQDAEVGHPDEQFLVECKRLLRLNGTIFVVRRKLTYNNNLAPWRKKALELNLSEVGFGRVRESFFIQWQKIYHKKSDFRNIHLQNIPLSQFSSNSLVHVSIGICYFCFSFAWIPISLPKNFRFLEEQVELQNLQKKRKIRKKHSRQPVST